MNNYLKITLFSLVVVSCSNSKSITQEDRSRLIDDQIAFYEREAQLMHEIGADGNEKTYREEVTSLKQQKEKQEETSFIGFILDLIFPTE